MSLELPGRDQPRSFLDVVASLVATAGGLGYTPKAPGTVGALAGVGLFLGLGQDVKIGLGVGLTVTLIGIWAATREGQTKGEHDPSWIVIDEVAGQFVALWLPWSLTGAGAKLGREMDWTWIGWGFLFFRLADILKPPPVRQLERLPAGGGVMADDLMAGIYAGLALYVMGQWGLI